MDWMDWMDWILLRKLVLLEHLAMLTNCSVVFSTSRVRTAQCGEYQGLIFWGGGDQLLSFLDFAPSTAFVFPSLHSAHSAAVGARFVLEKSRHRMSAQELQQISHLSPIDGNWEREKRDFDQT